MCMCVSEDKSRLQLLERVNSLDKAEIVSKEQRT